MRAVGRMVLLLALGAWLGIAQAAEPLRILILPYTSTLNLMRVHQPLRDYLARQLDRPVEIYTAPDFPSFYRDSVSGEFDLIITGPHFGYLAAERGFLPLVRYRSTLRPMFVVRRDSGIQRVEQLRGRTVTLSTRLSISSIVGQQWLAQNGLVAGRDVRITESPSHTSAILAVDLGESDAAITTLTPFTQAPDDLRARLAYFETPVGVPHLITLASPRVPAAEAARIKAVLHAFSDTAGEGRAFFETTGYQGYVDLTPEDLAALRPYAELTRELLDEAQ